MIQKLAIEEANRANKVKILRDLNTKPLLENIPNLEDKLEQALRAEASFCDLNYGFLSGTGDCAEVKAFEAGLRARIPSELKNKEERDAWLTKQRKDDDELYGLIQAQKSTSFLHDGCKTDIEMAKKKLDNTLAVIRIKTAQIEFLTQR